MALIQRGMYEQFAARHLAVKGPGALTNLEEGVMGTLPMDLSSSPPYWFIQGFRVFSIRAPTVPAIAGRYAKCAIHPPADTPILCFIQFIDVRIGSDTIGVHRCQRTDITADATNYGKGTDTRIPEDQDSQAEILGSDETPGLPGQQLFTFHSGNQIAVDHNIPLIVSPGKCIYIANHSTATELGCNICWVEIPAYKAEL
jgi:hypothetical protein